MIKHGRTLNGYCKVKEANLSDSTYMTLWKTMVTVKRSVVAGIQGEGRREEY